MLGRTLKSKVSSLANNLVDTVLRQQDEIARLQADVERLHHDFAFWRNEADERSKQRDTAWNEAIEAAKAIATESSNQANDTALMHPEDSDSRSRMFARAREATAIAAEIGALRKGDPISPKA